MFPFPSPLLLGGSGSASRFSTTGQFGSSINTGGTFTASAGELTLHQITARLDANSTFTTMDIDFGGSVTNGGKLKPVLYSDNAGSVGTLIDTGNEYTMATADASTTKVLSFASTQTLTAGTKYWIGWISKDTFVCRAFFQFGPLGTTVFKANTYASGAPSSPTGLTDSTKVICLRANVTIARGVAGYWDTDAAGVNYSSGNGEVDVIQITTPAGSTCNADGLGIRLGTPVTAGAKMKGVIYTDSSGSPSALVATGTEVTLAAAYDELTSTFSGVVLSASTTYWIGVFSNSSSRFIGKTGTTKFKGGGTYPTVPSTISSPSTSTTIAAVYLLYS